MRVERHIYRESERDFLFLWGLYFIFMSNYLWNHAWRYLMDGTYDKEDSLLPVIKSQLELFMIYFLLFLLFVWFLTEKDRSKRTEGTWIKNVNGNYCQFKKIPNDNGDQYLNWRFLAFWFKININCHHTKLYLFYIFCFYLYP